MPFVIEKERDPLYNDGLQKGLEKAEETAKETKLQIAKAMLKQNMDVEMIAKLTGLTKKEVEELHA